MPDSVEHRVEMHKLATERRKAGKPAWAHTVRLGAVFKNDELSIQEKAGQIASILTASSWLKETPEHSPVHEYVEELSEVDSVEAFDFVFSAIYDEADYARTWLDTSTV